MGTQTNCLLAGGAIGTTGNTGCHTYDGTNWATSPAMATGRRGGASGGTSTLTFAAGGNVGGNGAAGSNATEEFTGVATARSVDTT